MRKKAIGTLILFVLCLTGLKAGPVDFETAQKKAAKFYGVHARASSAKSLPELYCVYPQNRKSGGFVPYYIFNAGKNQGFVIVAGDDNATQTVLGYSLSGSFDMENLPDNLRYWLDFYEEGVKSAASSDRVDVRKNDAVKAGVAKEPLLGDINYNQSVPYNDLCPVDSRTGRRSMTGCVATALVSIARYYGYPEKGQGSITYSDKGETRSMDFSKNTYDWANILNDYNGNVSSYTEEQRTAIATIMRDMGHAVQMGYGSDASGAYRPQTVDGVVKYMGFDSILNYRERSWYDNDDQWIAVIKDNLDNDQPLYYSGQGDGGGHAFVFDGYDSADYFHVNWGWGGSYNGYFTVRHLDPEHTDGIGAGTGGGYTSMQGIIHNMAPVGQARCQDEYLLRASNVIEAFQQKVDSVYSIGKTPMEVRVYRLRNQAMSMFRGTVALAAWRDGEMLKVISDEKPVEISRLGQSDEILSFNARLDSLEDGEYEIWVVCKPEKENARWHKVYGSNGNRYTTVSWIPVRLEGGLYELRKTVSVLDVSVDCASKRSINMHIYRQGERLGSVQVSASSTKSINLRHGAYELRFHTRGYDTAYVDLNMTHDTAIAVHIQEKYYQPYLRGVRVNNNEATIMWRKDAPNSTEASSPKGFVVYLDSVEVARVSSYETEYVCKDVPKGRHEAGLRSIYETGESPMVVYYFTIRTDVANEPAWQGACRLSPNPSSDGYFMLEVDRSCRLQATDLAGKVLFEQELPAGTTQVDMNGYAAGIYVFRLMRDDGENAVLKAVVK